MAAASGCHFGDIDNGVVITSSCELDTGSYRFFCQFHCHNGYLKTSPRVYCAGNEIWLPSHPKERIPCVRDDRPKTTRNPSLSTPRTTIRPLPPHWPPNTRTTSVWVDRETTTRRGYYKDPHLEMNVSPAIFVAAVVGGIIAMVLIMFAIFFRAHKKARREHLERTLHCVDASNPIYANQQDNHEDDSIFRGIAQRIVANANSTNNNQNGGQTLPAPQLCPPPYDNIPAVHNGQANRSDIHNTAGERSPPYSMAVSFGSNFPTNTTSSYDQPRDHENGGNLFVDLPEVVMGDLDSPPPYEESIRMHNQEMGGYIINDSSLNGSNLPPPPPYSDA